MQLRLVETPSIPLEAALRRQADAWTHQGHACRVHELSNGGGYQIKPVPHQPVHARAVETETRTAA